MVKLHLEVVKTMLEAAESTPEHIEKMLAECKESLEERCICTYLEQKRLLNINRDYLSDYAVADLAILLIDIFKERRML
jgi:hypothetical protein